MDSQDTHLLGTANAALGLPVMVGKPGGNYHASIIKMVLLRASKHEITKANRSFGQNKHTGFASI